MERILAILLSILVICQIGQTFPIPKIEKEPVEKIPLPKSLGAISTTVNGIEFDIRTVEFCYYEFEPMWHTDLTDQDAIKCSILANTSDGNIAHRPSDPALGFLRKMLAQYKSSEKDDPMKILKCFATTPADDHDKCWNVMDREDWHALDQAELTKREVHAWAHLTTFKQFAQSSLNSTFVEYCYFNTSDWKKPILNDTAEYLFCTLLADKSAPWTNLVLFQQQYLDLEHNERWDRRSVFDCFLENKKEMQHFAPSPSDVVTIHYPMEPSQVCWKLCNQDFWELDPQRIEPANRRERNAQRLLEEYTQMDSKLDINFVEYCYYNVSNWEFNFTSIEFDFCTLIMGQDAPQQNIKWLQEQFQQYLFTELEDLSQMLTCFLGHKRTGQEDRLPECNPQFMSGTIREVKTTRYYNQLATLYPKFEACWAIAQSVLKGKEISNPDCPGQSPVLADISLAIGHCARFHRSRAQSNWEPCTQIRKSLTIAPTEQSALVRQIAWRNISANWKMEPEKVSDYMQTCMNDDSWLDKPKHICYSITNHEDKYTAQRGTIDWIVQDRWTTRAGHNQVMDFGMFHADEGTVPLKKRSDGSVEE